MSFEIKMGFSIYCIIEACLLIANAIAILNERFLRKGKFASISDCEVGFHVDDINNQS
jgi:hypothetical protein